MSESVPASKATVNKEASDETAEASQGVAQPDKMVGDNGASDTLETGGPTGPEPTRYGDWERKGRCIDF
jgi:hypothetical protein